MTTPTGKCQDPSPIAGDESRTGGRLPSWEEPQGQPEQGLPVALENSADAEAGLLEAEILLEDGLCPEDGSALEDGDDKRRGRRRSKTIARKQMLRERRKMLALGTIPEVVDYERPAVRVACRDAARPCMYVSCRYHLYLDVNPVTGSIKLNFPDKEVWELEETCALDVAERGGITLEEVGEIMNLTRERIRQVEVSGLEKLRNRDTALSTFVEGRELEVGPIDPAALRKGSAAKS